MCVQSISRHVFGNASDAGASNGRNTLKTFIAPVQSSLTKQQKLLKWVINHSRREAAPRVSWRTPAEDLTSGLTRSFEKLQELLQAEEVPSHAQIQRMMSSETLESAETVAIATPATDQVATTPRICPLHTPRERSDKVMDVFYYLEKTIPFHPHSSSIKPYQKLWKRYKYLSRRMTFEAFACINTFYHKVSRVPCNSMHAHKHTNTALASQRPSILSCQSATSSQTLATRNVAILMGRPVPLMSAC